LGGPGGVDSSTAGDMGMVRRVLLLLLLLLMLTDFL
jgi:hypothetical protein